MKKISILLCCFILAVCANAQRILQQTMPCKLLKGISERPYSICLPDDYDQQTDKIYPVLYLMHGGGGAHTDWQQYNHLDQIVDSLVHSGVIDNMVVVCPEGNQNYMMYFNAPEWKYEDYFFQELMPFIEKNYRVRTDKEGRAIAGFSMGGGAAVVYGVHHPELFIMVADISGYLRRQPLDFLRNDPTGEDRQRVIEANNPILRIQNADDAEIQNWRMVDWFITVGDHDFTLEANMDFVRQLRLINAPYNFQVMEGTHNQQYVSSVLPFILKRADAHFRYLFP